VGSVKNHVLQHSIRTDVIVVARNANFRFETADEPGAELEEILHLPTRPTIVVPDAYRAINTVLVAHDFSLHCARSLYLLLHLGLFPHAKHLVVHADPEGKDQERDWADGESYLREHGLEVEFILRNLEPAEAVMDVAQQRGADLVVLGPFRKSTVRRMLLGSVGQELLGRAKIPLLFGI
jgi:nucleotide-binding universal stress UspA family protein